MATDAVVGLGLLASGYVVLVVWLWYWGRCWKQRAEYLQEVMKYYEDGY